MGFCLGLDAAVGGGCVLLAIPPGNDLGVLAPCQSICGNSQSRRREDKLGYRGGRVFSGRSMGLSTVSFHHRGSGGEQKPNQVNHRMNGDVTKGPESEWAVC